MKKKRHGGYHIQNQISPKRFVGKDGSQVLRHRDALVFVTAAEAAEYVREKKLSELYAIVLCDCPPSEW